MRACFIPLDIARPQPAQRTSQQICTVCAACENISIRIKRPPRHKALGVRWIAHYLLPVGNCRFAQSLRLFERGWIDAQGAIDSEAGDEAGEEDEKKSLANG